MDIEIVDLPIDSTVIFHNYVNVYRRVDEQSPLSPRISKDLNTTYLVRRER